MADKIYDSFFLEKMEEEQITEYPWNGYWNFDGLDVQNLKCMCGYAKDQASTAEETE